MSRIFVCSDILPDFFALHGYSFKLVVKDVSTPHPVHFGVFYYTLYFFVACKPLDIEAEKFSDSELKGRLNPGKGVQIFLVREEAVNVGL